MSDHEKEKINQELNALRIKADTASQCMSGLQHELGAAIADIAFKHFARLKDIESDDIRTFGHIVSLHSWGLTTDRDKLNFKVKNINSECLQVRVQVVYNFVHLYF